MLDNTDIDDAYRAYGYIDGLLEKETIPEDIRKRINESMSRILQLMDWGRDYHEQESNKEKPKKEKCK
jgi:hypothetical protein